MTREEMLNYLADKRRLTAPVADAWRELSRARTRVNSEKKGYRRWLVGSVIFWGYLWIFTFVALYSILVGQPISEDEPLSFIYFMLFMLVLSIVIVRYIRHKRNKYRQAEKVLERAETVYSDEVNNPDYIAGKNGFPEKFYNYRDTYRLWKLISEGRALTLQEAYNLLETQQFQENQLSIQEEMKAMQADIASSSRVSAAANVATAYNSFKK